MRVPMKRPGLSRGGICNILCLKLSGLEAVWRTVHAATLGYYLAVMPGTSNKKINFRQPYTIFLSENPLTKCSIGDIMHHNRVLKWRWYRDAGEPLSHAGFGVRLRTGYIRLYRIALGACQNLTRS